MEGIDLVLYSDIGGKAMSSKVKRIGLFPNHNEKSIAFSKLLAKKLEAFGYTIDRDYFDLAIAVGGDGSFLRMVKDCSFNENIYYVGVNTGTLGFAQEIYPKKMDDFVEKLYEGDYKIEEIGTLTTTIITSDDFYQKYSLNEMIIRDSKLGKLQTKIFVNEQLLGRFIGDGLLIATSFGSTAQNRSYNGAIVYNDLHTLQVTPMGPINNESYRSLYNSIIMPEERKVSITPDGENNHFLITADGTLETFRQVHKIDTSVQKKIKCLKMTDYDYTKKIHEKLL